jgi:hypothetical protein
MMTLSITLYAHENPDIIALEPQTSETAVRKLMKQFDADLHETAKKRFDTWFTGPFDRCCCTSFRNANNATSSLTKGFRKLV